MDGPALFTWVTLLALTLISVLLFAERSVDGGLSAFAGQAAAVPGSEAEREGTAAKVEHTEVFPLTLFAVGGMMLFASANDLLICSSRSRSSRCRCTCSAGWLAAAG